MTLTNGPGGIGEFVALANVNDPASSFIDYTYVSWGASNFDWTVTLPTAPGDYEFRLYLWGFTIDTVRSTGKSSSKSAKTER